MFLSWRSISRAKDRSRSVDLLQPRLNCNFAHVLATIYFLGCAVPCLTAAAQTITKAPVALVNGRTVQDWAKNLHSDSAAERFHGALMLADFGPEAKAVLPALAGALRDADA